VGHFCVFAVCFSLHIIGGRYKQGKQDKNEGQYYAKVLSINEHLLEGQS